MRPQDPKTNEPTLDPRQAAENQQQQGRSTSNSSSDSKQQPVFQAPTINLPKGGGAIQGIGEKFQANPVTGTGSMSVPIAMSPGRGEFTPQLALSYDSGAGNSPFGLGWNIGLPTITRKTSKGLPEYDGLPKYYDGDESDVFLLSGAEDLVPVLENGEAYMRIDGDYKVYRYRPRIEGLFARIEKWVNTTDQSTYWKSVTKENITTIYGQSEQAKIVDPDNSWKVFCWKIEKTFNDKGNVICYEYKAEDGAGLSPKPIFEKNRTTYSQTYLKRVLYGNTVPYQNTDFSTDNEWLFELVLDYGEHFKAGDTTPSYEEQYTWPVRQDIFSSFRSGFDIRTYRLCRRILMFHHFEAELGLANYLVKVTHLEHEESPHLATVKSIQHTGYRFDSVTGEYVSKSYPPVSFQYTEQKLDPTIYEINAEDLPNAPQGIDGQQYQFTDLYGEGLSGILSQRNGAWYYKRNEGGGNFGAQQLVAELPSVAASGTVQVTDFGGDGLTDVIVQNGTLNGYYELSEEAKWSHFKPFAKPVNFDLNDPNLRMLDLDGNGIPDILLTENDCFVWYAADAKDGYKAARRVAKVLDEEQGPRIVFNESFQTIFLADMSGDGLTDIVRIRNGEICYWANQGYGGFSAKITMANAPQLDYPDYFDPARIRFADVDGTGSTDVLYLGRDMISYWLNQSGNGWSEAHTIDHFPRTTNLHTVSVFDLLGNGTSCIVWSSPLPAQANTPMKYIQLMGNTSVEGNKPYLLKEVNNNMGAVTRMKYEASTKFYLEDRRQGKPWITKLPFPVQVLIRQEIYDEIAGNHFVTRYAYHHGYFDKIEREFRGFGMVEQWDTEDYETLQQNTLFEAVGQNWTEEVDIMPPIYTKTWFHNGYYQRGGKVTRQYEEEYYQEDTQAWLLTDTDLPDDLTPFEKREAARAIKGRPLRVEVYGLDGTDAEEHPYTVTETKYHIKTIQHKDGNRHASFYVCACETLSYQYERNPVDPRIAHQHTLEIDAFGNTTKTAAIVYPRRVDEGYSEQQQTYVTYTEADFINKPDETDFYRIGVAHAQRVYEITGLGLTASFDKQALKDAITAASEIPYELSPSSGVEKRLVSQSKTTFYTADLSSELPAGELAFHALPYRTYEAVYTQGLIDKFNKDGNTLITASEIENEGGFIQDGDYWWRPSGIAVFDATHFYLPIEQADPFGQVYTTSYDAYYLAMTQTETEVSGQVIRSSAELDYRSLQPMLLTDPNGNRSQVIVDELGMVTATAIMGKVGETDPGQMGDSLDGYEAIIIPEGFDLASDLLAFPHDYLQGATTYFYYDFYAFQRGKALPTPTIVPNYTVSVVRETHRDPNTKVQINFSYADGFGQTIMMKVQAEPGNAFRMDNGVLVEDLATTRWVGNGRTVFNNKGNPVKQYEPYFSHSYGYEAEAELVEYGVTPIMHYDPLGRNIRTDLPDGTFTEVDFSPWWQKTYDQNDTVLDSQWYQDRGAPDATDPEPNVINNASNYDKRAAWLAANHSETPKVEHLDTLGRIFLLEDDNGSEGIYQTRFTLDIVGNQTVVTDAKGRLITRNHINMVQEPIHTESMDAGRRWSLTNIMGNPIYGWNDRDFQTRMAYDNLQRPLAIYVRAQLATEQLVYYYLYGERLPNPTQHNHLGQLYQLYDQAGCKTQEAFDFNGNPLRVNLRVCKDYKNTINWMPLSSHANLADAQIAVDPMLEAEMLNSSTTYDALNRPLSNTAPDGSQTFYTYNEANFLDKIATQLPNEATPTEYVANIDYDAKGQRTRIRYGNGVTTTYEYDSATFRLIRLKSTRNSGADLLQDLQYFYDPVGNITDMRDDAQQTLFFQNTIVEPHSSYTYDALYRLVKAKGREHPGQTTAPGRDHNDFVPSTPIPHANDGQAMRRYTRNYLYDELGNILSINHQAGASGQTGWSRTYAYHENSVLEGGVKNNQLSATTLTNPNSTSTYTHDIHGNMTRMSHLRAMLWDFADQLKEVELTTGREYYTYTIGGGKDFGVRTRKVCEQGGKIRDRIYFGDYEIYRERTMSGTSTIERTTLHLQDDQGRLTLIERLLVGNGDSLSIRYQLSNHLGSASLEVDDAAQLISYEEYYPFGASSYRAGRSVEEVQAKRYRYVGKELDANTGLHEYGARYYASWLCRFVSVDDLKDEYPFYTPFQYAGNKPVSFIDLDGLEEAEISEKETKNPEKDTPKKENTKKLKRKKKPRKSTWRIRVLGYEIGNRKYFKGLNFRRIKPKTIEVNERYIKDYKEESKELKNIDTVTFTKQDSDFHGGAFFDQNTQVTGMINFSDQRVLTIPYPRPVLPREATMVRSSRQNKIIGNISYSIGDSGDTQVQGGLATIQIQEQLLDKESTRTLWTSPNSTQGENRTSQINGITGDSRISVMVQAQSWFGGNTQTSYRIQIVQTKTLNYTYRVPEYGYRKKTKKMNYKRFRRSKRHFK